MILQTVITSTALTGKTRTLQALDGDKYQINLLSAADAYEPEENTEMEQEAMEMVQSQLVGIVRFSQFQFHHIVYSFLKDDIFFES